MKSCFLVHVHVHVRVRTRENFSLFTFQMSSSSASKLLKVLRTSVIGASLGAIIGVAAVFLKPATLSLHPPDDPDLHRRIINLKHSPEAQQVLMRMHDYKSFNQKAFADLELNLDRLVGIHILVSSPEPTKIQFEIQSARYRRNIELAIHELAAKYNSKQPSKQFVEDTEQLLKTVDGILFNIRQQLKLKFQSGQVNVR